MVVIVIRISIIITYSYLLTGPFATGTVDQHQPDAGVTWLVCKLLTGRYSYCNLTIHVSFFRFGC